MTFCYDDETDVLHIAFEANAGPCLFVETASGAILRIERGTNTLIGATIPYFIRKLKDGSLVMPELATTSMPSDFMQKVLAQQPW